MSLVLITVPVPALLHGAHLCLSTSTASGKSLIFCLHALQLLFENPSHRVLLIFPTKALMQDQLRALRAMTASVMLHAQSHSQHTTSASLLEPLSVCAYSGDTPFEQRAQILRSAHIVLSCVIILFMSISPCVFVFRKIHLMMFFFFASANPDMLHQSLLPGHAELGALFGGLRFMFLFAGFASPSITYC